MRISRRTAPVPSWSCRCTLYFMAQNHVLPCVLSLQLHRQHSLALQEPICHAYSNRFQLRHKPSKNVPRLTERLIDLAASFFNIATQVSLRSYMLCCLASIISNLYHASSHDTLLVTMPALIDQSLSYVWPMSGYGYITTSTGCVECVLYVSAWNLPIRLISGELWE